MFEILIWPLALMLAGAPLVGLAYSMVWAAEGAGIGWVLMPVFAVLFLACLTMADCEVNIWPWHDLMNLNGGGNARCVAQF